MSISTTIVRTLGSTPGGITPLSYMLKRRSDSLTTVTATGIESVANNVYVRVETPTDTLYLNVNKNTQNTLRKLFGNSPNGDRKTNVYMWKPDSDSHIGHMFIPEVGGFNWSLYPPQA